MSERFGTTALLHKEIANMSNEQKRHCRIGKVTVKAKPVPSIIPLDGWKWTPQTREWWQSPCYPKFATPNATS